MSMTPLTLPPPDYRLHDAALARLAAFGPSLSNGLFNHAPMVVEALASLGQGAAADRWLNRYAGGLAPRPTSAAANRAAMAQDELEGLVGDRSAYEAVAGALRRELADGDWRSPLTRWCERLAPGFTTAACHGVLRTAHAARALAEHDTPQRRTELADALAAWISMFTRLPVSGETVRGDRTPAEALAVLAPIPAAHRPGRGLLLAAYEAIAHAPDFAAQVAAADLSGPLETRIDEVAAVFAERFLRSASNDFEAIALTHTITATVAVAHLAPQVGEATARALLARAWEGGCALVASFGQGRAPSASSDELDSPTALASGVVAHGDDHAIKLTEACLQVFGRTGDHRLLEVPRLAQTLLEPLPEAAG